VRKNGKIYKKNKWSDFGEKEQENYKRANKSRRICKPSDGITQIARCSTKEAGQGSPVKVRKIEGR